ncbi:Abi family protein [Mesorhizobium sp.]|uniref:Abi family protein n=1 Tax=Mesorhizobium sp. TaxID=1871066 RepID=UPI000FEA3AF1|nr:Abi family protein [Mesorhizobium sp.]RWG08288.1 MAG: Abi family protein [Mesorhizobium sp.]TIN39499.1 MAG: Abi family protein [Mesorhizobium sp.]TIR89030.1 MAG: Abi family protein [Mesorhizobium sp.]TIS02077.1 MAG: Abi family protein [Mesorhizobium sp.]
MIITDPVKAELCLARIGYYRLSAYWYPFRATQTSVGANGAPVTSTLDQFKPDTTFLAALDLYVFDKKLRMITLDALERVEIALRTSIALLLGVNGRDAHRQPALLHGNFAKKVDPITNQTGHQKWLKKLDDAFDNSREEFVKHFKERYDQSNLPIWMAVELWDFGMLSKFFAGMRVHDKDKIAADLGIPSGRVLESWLRSLNVTRNICAHHSRLWNRPSVTQPLWQLASTMPTLSHISADVHAQTRYYASAVMLKFLLGKINPSSKWHDRLKDLMSQFPASPHITLRHAGFPSGWQSLPLWQ